MELKELRTVGDVREMAKQWNEVFIRWNWDGKIYHYRLTIDNSWYVKYINSNNISFVLIGGNISNWTLINETNCWIEYILGFTTDNKPEFEEWELVEVSQDNKNWYKRIFITKNKNGKIVAVANYFGDGYKDNKYFETISWEYVRKIPVDKDIVITTEDWQKITIKKSKAIELGFNID